MVYYFIIIASAVCQIIMLAIVSSCINFSLIICNGLMAYT